jgi:arsenical pump membrane protein
MCPEATEETALTTRTTRQSGVRWTRGVAVLGVAGALASLLAAPHQARSAAAQTWSPFVLVSGLLLVGMVAEADGLFRAAGSHLARVARNGITLFVGATLLVIVVTATLNLDTSVVFLTPVLIAAARQRGSAERSLLYGSLLLANASSLFLPGSNLTNLIVLGHHPLSGGGFLALMWPAALAASVVTACCVGAWARKDLAAPTVRITGVDRPRRGWGLGLAAVVVVVMLVLTLPAPALPVLGVGAVVTLVRVAQRRLFVHRAVDTLGAPVLVGLFGITVGLGTLGRVWSGPATLVSHLGGVGAAIVSAVFTVLFNNLPAASLLAARDPSHAAQLLVGLNLGPNLFATGSLAWFLWLRVARSSGAHPSVRQASRLGIVVVPLSVAAALGALALTGSG